MDISRPSSHEFSNCSWFRLLFPTLLPGSLDAKADPPTPLMRDTSISLVEVWSAAEADAIPYPHTHTHTHTICYIYIYIYISIYIYIHTHTTRTHAHTRTHIPWLGGSKEVPWSSGVEMEKFIVRVGVRVGAGVMSCQV